MRTLLIKDHPLHTPARGEARPKREDLVIDEGVILDPGSNIERTSHLDRLARETKAHGAPEFRLGPDPEGYTRPDTRTVTIRRKATA